MSPVKKVTVSKLKTTTENKFLKIDIKWIDGGGIIHGHYAASMFL